MTAKNLQRTRIALCMGLVFLLSSTPAHATVYGWQSEGGVLNLSNDEEKVPEAHRATATTFTSKLAGKSAAEGTAMLPPLSPETAPMSTYERGLERGMESAERQVTLGAEIARSVLAAVPAVPPIRIVIHQPPQTIVRYPFPGYDFPFYGLIGPYAPYFPYGFSYAYGFRHGRFVPHSHFFPGSRSRRRGLFFPQGHFSQDGFLFGHGFVVR